MIKFYFTILIINFVLMLVSIARFNKKLKKDDFIWAGLVSLVPIVNLISCIVLITMMFYEGKDRK